MCNFKSALILKDKVFVPDYDDHSQMIEELKLMDDRMQPVFVRAELVPPDNDVFGDIDAWNFVVDQDYLPDWFVRPHDETRMREAVKEWAKKHIFVDVDGLNIQAKDKEAYYLKDCKDATVRAYNSATVRAFGSATVRAYDSATVEAYDSATVEAYDSATVEAYDSATVEAYDSATVRAYNSATVRAYNSATVRAYDSATVRAYNSATVIIPDWSSNKRENIVILNNSTLKDCRTKTIYQAGGWKFELVAEERK
jgi:hypothetical protein